MRELLSVSFPLMLTCISGMTMIFMDRLLLAQYSVEALNAATNATTLAWGFMIGPQVLTSIAEVFVAQANGAGKREKLGEPVWQMLYVALASILFFLPLGLWGGEFFFSGTTDSQLKMDYFNVMMIFGPSWAVYSALVAFWIGRGKTLLITLLAVVANVINVGLDVVLIFGVDGWIEPMVTKGAAIATSIGAMFQAVVLGALFLRKEHREKHGTGSAKLNIPLMRECVRIGLPNAMFISWEVIGWAVFYSMMAGLGPEYMTPAAISQSVAILLWAINDGLNKGTTAIAGNIIGAKHHDRITDLLRNGLRFMGLVLLTWLVGLALSAKNIIHTFVDLAVFDDPAVMYRTISICLLFAVLHVWMEGVRTLFASVLTAAGDTLFLMISGTTWIWAALVLPVYVFVVRGHASIETAICLWVVYSATLTAITYARYRGGRWRQLTLAT